MLTITLPVAGIQVWVPGLVILGLTVGFLSGMFGVGGGFLLTPALRILFGIPYPVAVGSSLVQIFVASGLSAYRHWRGGRVAGRLGFLLAAGALAGTEVGVRLINLLQTGATVTIAGRRLALVDVVMNLLFLALLTGVCTYILSETAGSPPEQQEVRTAVAERIRRLRTRPVVHFPGGVGALSLWVPLLISFLVGVLTGLMGVGGGFIAFPLLIYVLGVPTHVAVGTSVVQILFASGYGALRHGLDGNVDPLLVVLIVVGAFGGVQLGVRASQLVGGRSLRRWFALVVAGGIVVVLWGLLKEVFL